MEGRGRVLFSFFIIDLEIVLVILITNKLKRNSLIYYYVKR